MADPKKPVTSKFQPLPTGKVFDVMPPGRSPASPTSRPVIMGHKPVADDQFVPDKQPVVPASDDMDEPRDTPDKLAVEAPPTEASVLAEPTVSPRDHLLEAGDDVASRKAPRVISSAILAREVDVTAAESLMAHADNEPATADADKHEDATASSSPQGPDAASPDVADQHGEKEKLLTPFTEQELARHMSHDDVVAGTHAPLFDHQQMIVSHHHRGIRIWQFLLVFLLVIILAIAALNFLLDAEAIQPGVNIPHTDIIGR